MKKMVKMISFGLLSLSLCACGNTQANTKQNTSQMNRSQTKKVELGSRVKKDKDSPTGYTVSFSYQPKSDKKIKKVSVVGPFNYIDPSKDVSEKGNAYTPTQYKNGYYPTIFAPSKGGDGLTYKAEMKYDKNTNTYNVSFPITSGVFNYSYEVQYEKGKPQLIPDPANPSAATKNKQSDFQTSDNEKSLVYGRYDANKQSKSLDMDYVNPVKVNVGKISYVEYQGNLSDHQDLGIYLPHDYDPNRTEPYKVVYLSHGGGGNETDWFGSGSVGNILDNLKLDYIAVTMDNSSYKWDFKKIEDNVINYIIPYMEKNYHVSKKSEDRAFCGLSMGAMTTMNMFFDHPESFGYFGSFSGTDMPAVKESEGIKQPTYYMTVGTTDMASEKILPNDDDTKKKKYEDFIIWEKEHPLPNFIAGGYIQGGHDWFTWTQSFKNFISDICWQENK